MPPTRSRRPPPLPPAARTRTAGPRTLANILRAEAAAARRALEWEMDPDLPRVGPHPHDDQRDPRPVGGTPVSLGRPGHAELTDVSSSLRQAMADAAALAAPCSPAKACCRRATL